MCIIECTSKEKGNFLMNNQAIFGMLRMGHQNKKYLTKMKNIFYMPKITLIHEETLTK